MFHTTLIYSSAVGTVGKNVKFTLTLESMLIISNFCNKIKLLIYSYPKHNIRCKYAYWHYKSIFACNKCT